MESYTPTGQSFRTQALINSLLKPNLEYTVILDHHVARKRIVNHIRKQGNTPVELSTRIVMYWWRILNQAVFYGKLPPPRQVKLVNHRNEFAWTYPSKQGRVRFTLRPRFVTRTQFLHVLVHEMVHGWEYMECGKMSHGRLFKSWQNRIQTTTTLTLSRVIRI